MAVCGLLAPRPRLLELYGAVPPGLNRDAFDSADGWRGRKRPGDAEAFPDVREIAEEHIVGGRVVEGPALLRVAAAGGAAEAAGAAGDS